MKSPMSAQRISLLHRMSSARSIFRAFRDGSFGNAQSVLELHEELKRVIEDHCGVAVDQTRVLDLGCGQTAIQTALFKADGADVVGIDLEVPTFHMNPAVFLKVVRTNGFERAVKSGVRHLLFDSRFFTQVSSLYGKQLPFRALDVRLMDCTRLDFPDDSFDFAFSSWVLEHVADVNKAVAEMARVVKPNGTGWVSVHLFPSLSGGHHLDWLNPEDRPSGKVPPWDHLRDNRFPVNTYLNRLHLRDYREVFCRCFSSIEEHLTVKGERFLTRELEDYLGERGFTREDLLTESAIFVCRRRIEKDR